MKSPVAGCILWTKSLNSDGYGREYLGGKYRTCHRLAYEKAYGIIPKGMCVLHKCDVRNCVNPEHLFLGTHTDNMRDMCTKGRGVYLKGEAHGMAKLTWAQVNIIRRYYVEVKGVTYAQLARKFGLSIAQIGNIILNLSWKVSGGELWTLQ